MGLVTILSFGFNTPCGQHLFPLSHTKALASNVLPTKQFKNFVLFLRIILIQKDNFIILKKIYKVLRVDKVITKQKQQHNVLIYPSMKVHHTTV